VSDAVTSEQLLLGREGESAEVTDTSDVPSSEPPSSSTIYTHTYTMQHHSQTALQTHTLIPHFRL